MTPMPDSHPLTIQSSRRANIDVHHGALRPATGVQSYQVLRANRGRPELAEGMGWTYNHAPMLAHWKGRFYLSYLSNPVEEHVAPGRTLLTRSPDGAAWERPEELFPVYPLPAACPDAVLEALDGEPLPEYAIMHQRMGFYVAPDGRLLALGFYGISPRPDVLPFDRMGIGRVVREVFEDGSFGSIYFIHLNTQAGWRMGAVGFPHYSHCGDAGFVEACEALLANTLYVQQWKEEHGDADPRIPLKGNYKAFVWYRLPDGRVAGFWKWALAGISADEGRSWESLGEVPTLEHAGGKIWAQRTADGRYALVYNPSMNNKHRWPLAVTSGADGLRFGELLVAAGRTPPRRYWGGRFKDYGLNYVRGITEGNGEPPDGALWVAYSMNKEDIWVSRIPVPVSPEPPAADAGWLVETGAGGRLLEGWNTYEPAWCRIGAVDGPEGAGRCLLIEDREPTDAALAERVVPSAPALAVRLRLWAKSGARKPLYVELWDDAGQIPARCVFQPDGALTLHHGRKTEAVAEFSSDRWIELEFRVFAGRKRFELILDGELIGKNQRYQGEAARDAGWYFRASCGWVSRVVFRTGPTAREPHLDQTVEAGADLEGGESPLEPTVYFLGKLETASLRV